MMIFTLLTVTSFSLTISGCHKSGTDSSAAQDIPQSSPQIWLCDIDEHKTDIGCVCGNYIIPNGTQCMNEQPACNGKPIEYPISGFGCADEKEGSYVCRFPWGCLAGDLVCHEGQIYKNDKCLNTEMTKQSNKIEVGMTCDKGDCLCGNVFCPKDSKCIISETTGKESCICGESSETDHCNCDEDDDGPNECIDGHMRFCRDDDEYSSEDSADGLFSCDSNEECGTQVCVKQWGFLCEHPGGCYEDNSYKSSHQHFVKGGKDYSVSLDKVIYGVVEEYGLVWADRCPYHIDGIYDVEETLCGSGDCVIPMDHGICGLMDIHTGTLTKNGEDSYDPVKCIGGTRYCHGKNNPPIIAPKESDGYLCTQLIDKHNPMRPQPRPGVKAWVCKKDSCICGGESCLKDMVCHNEKCISQEQVPDKDGNVSETNNPKANSAVQRIEYNEYKVSGT